MPLRKLSSFPLQVIDSTTEVIGTHEQDGFRVNGKYNIGEKFAEIENSISSLNGVQGDYLKLDGSTTMTGAIKSDLETHTHIQGNQGNAIINSTASGAGYTMLARMKSRDGIWTLGNYTDSFKLYYTTNANIAAGNNSTTYDVTLLNQSGNAQFPKDLTVKQDLYVTRNATAGTMNADKYRVNSDVETFFDSTDKCLKINFL